MAAALALARRGADGDSKPSSEGPSAELGEAGMPAYLSAVQKKCDSCAGASEDEEKPLQQKGDGKGASRSASNVHGTAAKGVAQADAPLPGAARIQAAFGRHDVSGVRAQVGGPAAQASQRMGARAYTVGNRIGFKSDPDIKLAAHEAAHVVQQRQGVRLKDRVGRVGDKYEQQADAVAERVAANESAEDLLDDNPADATTSGVGTGTSTRPAVQAKCACGGTCAKCRGEQQEEKEEEGAGAVQMDLEPGATRLFEPMAQSSGEDGGEGAASAEGDGAGDAQPAAKGNDAGDGGRADAGGDGAQDSSVADSSGAGGAGGGASGADGSGGAGPQASGSAGPDASNASGAPGNDSSRAPTSDAPAADGTDALPSGTAGDASGSPAASSAAPATPTAPTTPAAGGAGGGAPATGAGCSGGGTPTCYRGERVEPEKPPNPMPPNPPQPEVKEETNAGEDEELPEPDDCSQALAASPAGAAAAPDAGAPPVGAPPAEATPASDGAAAADATASSPGGAAQADSPPQAAPAMSAGSPMDGVVAAAEGQRDAAVAGYGSSRGALAAAGASTATLRGGVGFAAQEGEGDVAAAQRRTASARADGFFSGAADRLDSAIALAGSAIPDQLGASAQSAKVQIASAIESEKGNISSRIEQARRAARDDAGLASAAVRQQSSSYIGSVHSQSTAAINALTAAYTTASGQIDQLETTTLGQINATYASGRSDLEGVGTTIGDECTAKGTEFAATYRTFKTCTRDGAFDGNLAERRANAQAEAAEATAKGYHDRLVEAAKTQARSITKAGRKSDRCSVITTAQQSRTNLDQQFQALTQAVQATRDAAIGQANSTRDGLLSSIRAGLRSTLQQLDQQEHAQRQTANDTGYIQQVLQDQIAHTAAAAIQTAVTGAVDNTQQALAVVQAQCAASPPPDLSLLERTLLQVEQNISVALAGLEAGADSGALKAEQGLADGAQQGIAALAAVTGGNDEQATAIGDGFTTSMSTIAGVDNFAQQRTTFTQQIVQSTSAGCAALTQVASAMRQGCETTLTAAKTALTQAHTDLEGKLRGQRLGLECEMTTKATSAAADVAPAWKAVFAVLIVILVIIIVVVVTVLTAGGALAALGPIAAIAAGAAIGAAVGAVTAAMLSVASDLWHNREVSGSRALDAAIEGAITGAIGGGLGAGAGLLTKGASIGVQLGAQLLVAGAVNSGAQFYHTGFSLDRFSFKSLGFTLLVTALTFGLSKYVASRVPNVAPPPEPPGAPPSAVKPPVAAAPPEPVGGTGTPPEPITTPTPKPAPAEIPVPQSKVTGPPRLELIQGGKSTSGGGATTNEAPVTDLPPEFGTGPAANDNAGFGPPRSGGGYRPAGGPRAVGPRFDGTSPLKMDVVGAPAPAAAPRALASVPAPAPVEVPTPLKVPTPVEAPVPVEVPSPVEVPTPGPGTSPRPGSPPVIAPTPVIPPEGSYRRPKPAPPVVAPVPPPVPGRPVMPAGLTKAEQDLWNECSRMHDEYEVSKAEVAARQVLINNELQALLLVPAGRRDYTLLCDLLDEQIKQLERLARQRLDYVDAGCDAFDWFNRGTTAAQREAAHRAALAQLQLQLNNVRALKEQYC